MQKRWRAQRSTRLAKVEVLVHLWDKLLNQLYSIQAKQKAKDPDCETILYLISAVPVNIKIAVLTKYVL